MIGQTKRLLRRLSYDTEKSIELIQDNLTHINKSLDQLTAKLTSVQEEAEKAKLDTSDRLQLITEASREHNMIINKVSAIESALAYVSLDKLVLGATGGGHNHTKPRILLCGFYGANNLGDELMLESILEIIREDKYAITVMVSDNEYLDVSKYADLQIIHAPKMVDDYYILSDFYDLMIVGGGAMIDDDDYAAKKGLSSLTYSLIKLSRCFINKHKQSLWVGVSSVSKLENKELVRDLKEVVNSSDYFSMRDRYSLLALGKAGIDTKKVRLAHDLVFYNSYLANMALRKAGQLDCAPPLSIYKVGIILVLNDNTYKRIEDFLAGLLSQIGSKRESVEVRLISFYDYLDNDHKYFQKLAAALREMGNFEIIDVPASMEELTKILIGCDFVVSMRYHATLISNILGRDTLCIDLSEEHRHYKNKMDNLYDSYKFAKNRILLDQLQPYSYSSNLPKTNESKQLVIEAFKQSTKEASNLKRAITNSLS